MGNKHTHRPINEKRYNDINSEPDTLLSPLPKISENESIPTLLDAIKPCEHLVTDLRKKSEEALSKCRNPKDGLSCDQSAAVYLYTIQWPREEHSFYFLFNRALRDVDSTNFQPYQSYHTLFMSALKKLPSNSVQVWRAIRGDLTTQYYLGSTHVWQGVSSCTDMVHVTGAFLKPNEKQTLFHIKCYEGKTIHNHSAFSGENETILPPGTYVTVVSSLLLAKDIYLVDMQQVPPDPKLLVQTKSVVSSAAVEKPNILHLIWCDSYVNKSAPNSKTKGELRSIFNNNFETFETENQCEDFIQHNKNYDLILIISGQMGQVLVPKIHDLKQIKSVYIYCMNKEPNEKWSKEYNKVKSVITESRELVKAIVREKEIPSRTEAAVSNTTSVHYSSIIERYVWPDYLNGCETQPLLSFENTLQSLYDHIPNLRNYVEKAMQHVEKHGENCSDGLTLDDLAAICIYTMEFKNPQYSLNRMLNADLRSKDQNKLRKWFPYLKLLLTALDQLPSFSGTVWRGINENMVERYPVGTKDIWQSVSSATMKKSVIEQFLHSDKPCTFLSIECFNGKILGQHSYTPEDEEIVLMPGFYFEVANVWKLNNDLHVVHLKEIRQLSS